MRSFLIIFCIATVSVSFTGKPKWTEKKINNLYSIFVYNNMKETKDLNESASLQYQDTVKQMYLMVIEEDKKSLNEVQADYKLDPYFNFVLDNLKGLENFKSTDPVSITINGMKARQCVITGSLDNLDLYYILTVVESNDHLFQVLTWTVTGSKTKLKVALDAMVKTFKVL
jgi:hypothetical protein